jgi:hypothetical protein
MAMQDLTPVPPVAPSSAILRTEAPSFQRSLGIPPGRSLIGEKPRSDNPATPPRLRPVSEQQSPNRTGPSPAFPKLPYIFTLLPYVGGSRPTTIWPRLDDYDGGTVRTARDRPSDSSAEGGGRGPAVAARVRVSRAGDGWLRRCVSAARRGAQLSSHLRGRPRNSTKGRSRAGRPESSRGYGSLEPADRPRIAQRP